MISVLVRRRGALGVALALLALLLPATAARADTGSITVVGAVGDQATATFSVTKTSCATAYYCGWFAYATRQPAGQPCSTATPVWVDTLRDGLITTTATAGFYSFASEGAHRLCLYVYENSVDVLVAETVYSQNAPPPVPTPPAPTVTPVPTPAPVLPAAVDTTPIPRTIGRTDTSDATLAIFTRRLPYGVDQARFVDLVRGVAKRWDIYTGGVSHQSFVFARPDGRNGIGFAYLDEGDLGVTNTYTARLFRRRWGCRRHGGHTSCRYWRVYVGRRVVERDTAFAADLPWQEGPAYPGPDEYDLESVMIHELGHWAGNRHVRGCTDSPMVPSLDYGDWWRSLSDFNFAHCATASAASVSQRGRVERRDHTVEVTLPAHLAARAEPLHVSLLWARRAKAGLSA